MAMTGFCKNQDHQKPAKVLVGDRLYLPLQSSQFKSTLECDHLGSRRLINVLLTKWIQKFAIGTSVTIWPDYLCNIWSFTAMKICPKAKFLYQSRLHILPNTKKPSKNCQRLLKFCQIWSHWTARRVYPFEQRKRCSEGGLRDRQRPQQRDQHCLIWGWKVFPIAAFPVAIFRRGRGHREVCRGWIDPETSQWLWTILGMGSTELPENTQRWRKYYCM